jgi:hypothetical protein
MQRFKLDVCDIRDAALAWRSHHNTSLPEFCDYVVRIARDNGYSVTGTRLNDGAVEIRLSTAEIIEFHGDELR